MVHLSWGGYLVIGFDNDTLQPDIEHAPTSVQSAFHFDKIQGLISRFSSEPFEISVEFPKRESQEYPVIIVPPGVRTPVASKSDLLNGDTKLISTNDVYVRSLQSNNTPSTTKARWKDWSKIVEVCFDNREADIGRFLRRHLSGLDSEIVREFAMTMMEGMKPQTSFEDYTKEFLQDSYFLGGWFLFHQIRIQTVCRWAVLHRVGPLVLRAQRVNLFSRSSG